jgi:hypothetical protein
VDVDSGVLSGLARQLKIDPEWLIGAGGASGSAWIVREMNTVLRVGSRLEIDVEAEAHRLAAQLLPVPRVLDRADFEGSAGLLLEWMPGQTAFEAARLDPAAADRIGTACGALHDRIDLIPAPAFEHRVGPDGLERQRLLHLDLHPKNVLVDEHGEVTAVLDWANAARGPRGLDRARTWSILTLDPATRAFRTHRWWQQLAAGWSDRGGFQRVRPAERVWACEFMLNDLLDRYAPDQLQPVREALDLVRSDRNQR